MITLKQFIKAIFSVKTPEQKAQEFVDGLILDFLPAAKKYVLKVHDGEEVDYYNFLTIDQVQSWLVREVEKRYGVGTQRIKLQWVNK